MDTSKEYIEMCEKAVEVQKGWEVICGDVYVIWWPSRKGHYLKVVEPQEIFSPYDIWFEPARFSHNYKNNKDCCNIWLPRQDQLQEMVHDDEARLNRSAFGLFADMGRLLTTSLEPEQNKIFNYMAQFKESGEQLWLAFVMKEKYGKVWKDGDWLTN